VRGDEQSKKLVQVGQKPALCLFGIDSVAELDAALAKDTSDLEP
jgi:hypothetical protein